MARQNRSSRQPGWYVEPDSISSVERFWDSNGPTDMVRFPDPSRIGEPLQTDLPNVPQWDKHPYRMGSAKWWLTCIPWVGSYFVPDYVRGRREALARGEIKRWPTGWRVAFYVVGVCLVVYCLINMWNRISS